MITLHVDDFVVLGRTVPEESKTYGKRVCMAGYSPGINQFLRVYPLMVPVGDNVSTNGFRARHSYAMDLTRNTKDNRMESWRVLDEKKPTTTLWAKAQEIKKDAVVKWLETRIVDGISTLNACRLSLGVLRIRAGGWKGVMVPRTDDGIPEAESTLFEDLKDGDIDPDRISTIPYISFRDEGGNHRLQVREWGAYRLLMQPRYANDPSALWSAPGYRSDRDLLVVIGNMNNYRTNWLIIKTFELKRPDDDTPLFSSLE